jgi:hypothetical protein
MAISIGGVSFSRLIAQPLVYDATNGRAGLVARRWVVSGLVTPSEWLSLVSVYDAWRALRINDEDSLTSESIGTTVLFSGTGAGGQTWSNIACWFDEPPVADQNGYWLAVTASVIDANEALAVLLREQALATEQEDLPDFGTITINGVVLTLKKPVDTYGEGPSVNLTAGGVHYIEGPKVVYKIKDIEGATTEAGWNNIRAWYEATIVTTPTTGDLYPISVPIATAERKVISGVKTTEYIVTMQLGQII